jgi:hypothetical protein
MRKTLKIFHTLSSCGLLGGLAAYAVLLLYAPQDSAQQLADVRLTISHLANYILIPSLGVALVTGLLALMVHRPFQEMRWVWLKALLGFALFESTLAVVSAKAGAAATAAQKIVEGAETPENLAAIIASEWTTLAAIVALSVAQVVVGVWRPPLAKRRPARKPDPAPVEAAETRSA